MSATGKDILTGLQRRWRFLLGLEIFLYALGPAVLLYFLGFGWIWTLMTFLSLLLLLTLLRKPWRLTLSRLSGYLDWRLKSAEYSTGLLLLPKERLTTLAALQQQKVTESLKNIDSSILPMRQLKSAGIVASVFLTFSFLTANFGWFEGLNPPNKGIEHNEIINFRPADSTAMKVAPPKLVDQLLTIKYPSYTGQKTVTTSEMNVKALVGSQLFWRITFDSEVDSVFFESNSEKLPMPFKDGNYMKSIVLKEAGFYSFRFVDMAGGNHVSDLYALEVTTDQPPSIEIRGLKQFASFEPDETKHLGFKTLINDDYGIADAQIVATVSRGSGESVKFREEKLPFDTRLPAGRKNIELSKKIDLDLLKMEPGDELYFYVEVQDTKRPKSNTSRSETFFAKIKDTVTDQFAVESTMGADLMPDYFRSQRQLIIDTEKLIAEKSSLTEQEFNATSNELGFDQKALRLKYGEFMGDEADSGIQVAPEPEIEEQINDDDPLAEFTHDHDGDNEHNLVEHDHDHEEAIGDENKDDPLEAFLHDHDDPEEATLFTQSLRSKLKQAMAEMWDAELYLRLYTPKKSLPYQYRALKLIQEIKNSARIYVHRIGFDPPPIKEEVRLTGDITEVNNYQKKMDVGKPIEYSHIRKAINKIETILSNGLLVKEADKVLFEEAGIELGDKAIAEPGKYLETLQKLKRLTEDTPKSADMWVQVQRGLLMAISEPEPSPRKESLFIDDINGLLLKELEAHDR